MVPVRANRQPGWGEYVRDPATGGLRLVGVLVAVVSGERIRELVHFETGVAASFGLPRTLDD
jgi:RNA polymerase sigma-70 factor (ECF subfamily)